MILPYREGTWFAVPLRRGGFGVGVVARATATGKVILCYFFGPRLDSLLTLAEVEVLKPGQAVRAMRVGDLALIRGEWPVIGHSRIWKRSEWQGPSFIRREELSGWICRVYYSDSDPSVVLREERLLAEDSRTERDALFGSGAAEIVLTELLL